MMHETPIISSSAYTNRWAISSAVPSAVVVRLVPLLPVLALAAGLFAGEWSAAAIRSSATLLSCPPRSVAHAAPLPPYPALLPPGHPLVVLEAARDRLGNGASPAIPAFLMRPWAHFPSGRHAVPAVAGEGKRRTPLYCLYRTYLV